MAVITEKYLTKLLLVGLLCKQSQPPPKRPKKLATVADVWPKQEGRIDHETEQR